LTRKKPVKSKKDTQRQHLRMIYVNPYFIYDSCQCKLQAQSSPDEDIFDVLKVSKTGNFQLTFLRNRLIMNRYQLTVIFFVIPVGCW